MTSAITGSLCEVKVGGVAVGELRNYNLDISANMIDATSNDSGGWEESIVGRKSWTASAEYFHIFADAAQTTLLNGILNNTLLTFEFQPQAGSGKPKYTGSGYLSDWKHNPTENAALLVNVSIKGSGSIVAGTQS